MEQEQDSESDEGIQKATMEESWAVIGYDHGVIGEAGYGEDHDDHDGPERTQGRTELEHVPRHCCFGVRTLLHMFHYTEMEIAEGIENRLLYNLLVEIEILSATWVFGFRSKLCPSS